MTPSHRVEISIPVSAHDLLTARFGTRITALARKQPAGGVGQVVRVRSGVAPRQTRMTRTSRAVIRDVHPVRLGDLTHGDAVACGYRDLRRLRVHWIRTHDEPGWDEAFRTSRKGDDDAAARWQEKWAHRQVWAVVIEHDPTHQPRLLHKRSQFGYTASPREAMEDEPEAMR